MTEARRTGRDGGRETGGMQARKQKPHSDVGNNRRMNERTSFSMIQNNKRARKKKQIGHKTHLIKLCLVSPGTRSCVCRFPLSLFEDLIRWSLLLDVHSFAGRRQDRVHISGKKKRFATLQARIIFAKTSQKNQHSKNWSHPIQTSKNSFSFQACRTNGWFLLFRSGCPGGLQEGFQEA